MGVLYLPGDSRISLQVGSGASFETTTGSGLRYWFGAVQTHTPDLLVTDIEMPGLTGLELAQRIQRQQLPVRVVIVTTFARAGSSTNFVSRRATPIDPSWIWSTASVLASLMTSTVTMARGEPSIRSGSLSATRRKWLTRSSA